MTCDDRSRANSRNPSCAKIVATLDGLWCFQDLWGIYKTQLAGNDVCRALKNAAAKYNCIFEGL
jgi:hypothetical protein